MLKWHLIKSEFFLISNLNQAGYGGNALDLHLEGACFLVRKLAIPTEVFHGFS